MQNNDFDELAHQLLIQLHDIIETHDIHGNIEADLQDGVLYLDTTTGFFVINKHSAAKEIWLASPLSGPYHFFYKNNSWQNKTNIDLLSLLTNELKIDFCKYLENL